MSETISQEALEKYIPLFPDVPHLSKMIKGVQFLVRNNFGLVKQGKQSAEQFELECLLRYQYCEVMGIPISRIGETYIYQGRPALEVDLMMYLVNKYAPEAEFNVIQCNSTVCVMEGRRNPESKWIRCKWDIDKAKAVVKGFSTKPLWKDDPEDMLNARCYGSLVKWICRKEINGGKGFLSKEEIDSLNLGDKNE